MTIRKAFRALPLLALFTAGALAAPLNTNFTSSLLSAGRGQTVTFSASLFNTMASTIFLNSDAANITAPLSLDDTKFFLNFPLSIGAGLTIPATPIFDVFVPAGTPFGIYPGTFDILGGDSPNAFITVGLATFAVNVVPEPGTVALAGLALVLLIAGKRVRRLCQIN